MLILSLVLAVSGNWWEPSVVFDITDDNSDKVLGKSQHVIIEYFAPYCHWCRMMFHEYEELSRHYNSDSSAWKRDDILIARVNSMNNHHVTSKYQVYAFPTIIFIPAHSQELKSMFQGPRTKGNFIDWIEGQIKELKEHKFDERIKEEEAGLDFDDLEKEELEREKERMEKGSKHEGHDIIDEVVEEVKDGEKEEQDEDDEDYDEEEHDKYAKFEMVIEDVSSHASEKWRGEFTAISIKLDEIIKYQQESSQDLLVALSSVKQGFSDQMLQILKKVESNSAKIDEVMAGVINRNNVESTQSRFNPIHMVIFLVLGVIIGFAFSVYLVKIKPVKDFNKV